MSDNETPAGDTRKCPHCAEWIKAEAVVCRYCGRDVTPTVTADTEAQAASESETPEETSTGKHKPWLIWVIVGGVVVVGAIVIALVLMQQQKYEIKDSDSGPCKAGKRLIQNAQDYEKLISEVEGNGGNPESLVREAESKRERGEELFDKHC